MFKFKFRLWLLPVSLLAVSAVIILTTWVNKTLEKPATLPQNKLAGSISPYLLQHADNPVNWFPWGEEAFAQARKENKPIFLSIGYAACHWCHVMERESFENEKIADFLNEHFISIKVDREERPDVDEIYMSAVQMIIGSGGWPLSVFLTPDLEPFYGGTYFPSEDQLGRPGFFHILEQIVNVYTDNPQHITNTVDQIMQGLNSMNSRMKIPGDYNRDIPSKTAAAISRGYDPHYGGFGSAPKFPPTGQLDILLRLNHSNGQMEYLKIVENTLEKMGQGGIYDQLGGGFHRYSTDEAWLVPHFEKMLYDNALLTQNYLDAFLVTGNELYAEIARSTLDWMLREMQDPDGGFYSSLDADSEGEEGLFYVWTKSEIVTLLGEEDSDLFCERYGVSEQGNFENGKNILHVAVPIESLSQKVGVAGNILESRLSEMRQKFLETRNDRVRPATDDKVLTDWNGLAIAALAQGYRVLRDEKYLDAAKQAADFFMTRMWDGKTLIHNYRYGETGTIGILDDYAFLIEGLVELYQTGFHPRRLEQASELADRMIELFWDADNGGFFEVSADRTDLIQRRKNGHDSATPAGNALAAKALLTLSQLTGQDEYLDYADRTARAFATEMESYPAAYVRLSALVNTLANPLKQVAIVGCGERGSGSELLSIVYSSYLPETVVAYSANPGGDGIDLLEGRYPVNDKPAAYVCTDFTCRMPVTDPEELRKILINKVERERTP